MLFAPRRILKYVYYIRIVGLKSLSQNVKDYEKAFFVVNLILQYKQ